jgi:hypothetical protein
MNEATTDEELGSLPTSGKLIPQWAQIRPQVAGPVYRRTKLVDPPKLLPNVVQHNKKKRMEAYYARSA